MNSLPNYLNYNDEFRAIETCIPFAFIPKCNFPESEPLVKEIIDSMQLKDFQIEKTTKYVQIILVNLANAAYQGKGIGFFNNAHFWSNVNVKVKLESKISFRVLSKILNTLEVNGYVVRIIGKHNDIQKSMSYSSRYFASEVLLTRLKEEWAQLMAGEEKSAVKLYNEQEKDITPNVLPLEIKKREVIVKKVNNLYSESYMTAVIPALKRVCTVNDDGTLKFRMRTVNQKKRFTVQLQSIYKHSFNYGGRLYSVNNFNGLNYQAFSSKEKENKVERKTIEINGMPTCEVDFKCLHVNLAYAQNNMQFDGDAYDFTPNRSIAKKVLLIALNSASYKEAINAISYHCLISKDEAKNLIDEMLKRHQPLKNILFHSSKCYGLELQYQDSNIMANILERLSSMNIVALPVHDSVIVANKYKSTVIKIMVEEYKKLTGFSIIAEVK